MSTATLKVSLLEDLAGRQDLYGPIWTAITFAVSLFMASTAGNFLPHTTPPAFQPLSSSLSLVFFYLGLICFGGWMVLKWLGADSIQVVELTCLIGYSLVLFYPVVVGRLLIIRSSSCLGHFDSVDEYLNLDCSISLCRCIGILCISEPPSCAQNNSARSRQGVCIFIWHRIYSCMFPIDRQDQFLINKLFM